MKATGRESARAAIAGKRKKRSSVGARAGRDIDRAKLIQA